MTTIHPTAIVEDGASLGADVYIGPYSIVGAHVKLADRVRLESHVVVTGKTSIGEDTRVFPFASLGHRPQDLKFHGEESELVIGKRNQIREHVTMQGGTEGGGLLTTVGDDGLFMASSHVAHDCVIGNHVILANNVMIAGHCTIGDFVIFGGGSGAHQFIRVGQHAFIGGLSGSEYDVIPYGMVTGNRGGLSGLNLVGLRRRGFDREEINMLRRAYRMLFSEEGTLQERVEDVANLFGSSSVVMEIVEFIRNASDRRISMPRGGSGND
ncbi:MAG: acyl-ACP--UDP-N-acetylglucosamine O-acyltransferase [Hyphomicrobiaceae bacterium]|nr:acyl-ACP--UDP-N-acetylglucosamine O-acyltransferase [Hyphomicrobiaceae bacterium]